MLDLPVMEYELELRGHESIECAVNLYNLPGRQFQQRGDDNMWPSGTACEGAPLCATMC